MQRVVITKWGNSQGIRIPVDILRKANLKVSDPMTIEAEGDTIILRKEFRHKSFSERLAEYDGKIETCDFDWGEPMGGEGL